MKPQYSVLPLFLFSCLNAEAFAQGIRALPTVNGTDANLSQIYYGAVSSKSLDMYLYSYKEMTNQVMAKFMQNKKYLLKKIIGGNNMAVCLVICKHDEYFLRS